MLFLSPALHLAATGRATVNYFRDFYNLGPEKVLLFAYEFNRPKSAVAPASVSDGPLRLLVANSFYPRKDIIYWKNHCDCLNTEIFYPILRSQSAATGRNSGTFKQFAKKSFPVSNSSEQYPMINTLNCLSQQISFCTLRFLSRSVFRHWMHLPETRQTH